MTEVQVDIIELAGDLGHQAGQIDGLSGNAHGAGIPKVKMDIRDTIRDLNPVMRSSFWIVFDREYEIGWNRGKTERQG